MNFNRLLLACLLFCGMAPCAYALRNPTPPPSGIVVHLFGPDSVMSNVVPNLPGESPKPVTQSSVDQRGSAQPGGTASADLAATTAPAAPQQADSDVPTIGAVLHQMFVVGDPDHPNQPSAGRVADRPPSD